MEIDKKGNIINAPQFKIHGEDRRSLKKKHSALKSSIRMFWFYDDIHTVYGGGISKEQAEQRLSEMKIELLEMEKKLQEPFIP